MTGKSWAWSLGCIAIGAVGAVLFMKNKEKMKPAAANLLAKGMKIKKKALDYAAKTREHAEDIVAEAKHINDTSPDSEA
jgi:hypothetical protein